MPEKKLTKPQVKKMVRAMGVESEELWDEILDRGLASSKLQEMVDKMVDYHERREDAEYMYYKTMTEFSRELGLRV